MTIENHLAALVPPTRRQVFAGFAGVLGSLALASRCEAQPQSAEMQQMPATAANQARTSIHYEINFKPSPQRIYETLLDAKQFAAFSGLPAVIEPKSGGSFSLFGGLIVGRNIELIENQRIVQAWRPTHWDSGVYSIVRFELKPRGAEAALAFDHTGFPAGEYDHLDWGWHNHYWEPLKKFFA
jgi:activator of HSP90 ATPase